MFFGLWYLYLLLFHLLWFLFLDLRLPDFQSFIFHRFYQQAVFYQVGCFCQVISSDVEYWVVVLFRISCHYWSWSIFAFYFYHGLTFHWYNFYHSTNKNRTTSPSIFQPAKQINLLSYQSLQYSWQTLFTLPDKDQQDKTYPKPQDQFSIMMLSWKCCQVISCFMFWCCIFYNRIYSFFIFVVIIVFMFYHYFIDWTLIIILTYPILQNQL